MRVRRQDFIDCVNGDLMRRDKRGVITHLGDAASNAVEALESGMITKVLLTVDGKDYSEMIRDGDGFKEVKL